jgi:two-component system response regulator
LSDTPILLVEDNPDDVALTRRAFSRNKIANPIVVARDGAEAIEWLFNGPSGPDGEPILPALVLLDVNLPKIGGLEVLRRIRADDRTKLIRVIMLTSSGEERDIEASFAGGANSYIRKPVDFDNFVAAVGQLGLYWLILDHGGKATRT